MTRKRVWRWALAILMPMFIVALAIGVINAVPAKAAEDGVLPNNTAEYTFENDTTVPWAYKEDTNEWFVDQYSAWTAASQDTTFRLKVTTSGNVVFKWKMNTNSSNENKLTIVYRTQSGTSTTLLAKQTSHSDDYLNWHEVTQPVTAGDELIFTATGPQKSSQGEYNGDYTEYSGGSVIQGLRVVETTENPFKSVEVSSDVGGSVSIPELTDSDGKYTFTPELGKMYVATATAQEGYVFKYWADETNTILSRDQEFTIPYWRGKNIRAQFIKNDGTFEVSLQTNIKIADSAEAWKDNGGGVYQYSSIGTMGDFKDGQKLLIDFYGDSYFTLHYIANFGTMNSIVITMDGATWTKVDGNAAAEEYYFFPYHVLGNKVHTAIVYIYTSNKNASAGNDTAIISNISVTPISEVELHEFKVDFDENLADVTVNGRKLTNPQTMQFADEERINLSANGPRKDAVSSVVESESVQSDFVEWQYRDKSRCVNYNSTTVYFSKNEWHFDDGSTKTADEGYIYAAYKEHLPYPKVNLTMTANGHSQPEQVLTNGQTIELPFGKSSSLVFSIEQFEGFNLKYTVQKIDSTGTNDVSVVTDYKTGFTLNDIQDNTEIQITITDLDGKFANSLAYSLKVSMVDEAGVQAIVNPSFDINVENDSALAWYLDPANNGEETYAYKAGNSNTTSNGDNISQLKFDVSHYTAEKAGQLKFDFKFDGPHIVNYKSENEYYAQATYSIGSPISILGSGYPGWYNENSKETINGTVFAKGGSDENGWKQAILLESAQALGETAEDWYTMSVPVDKGAQIVYVGLVNSYSYKYKTNEMTIRNVMFVQGNAQMNWGIKNSSKEEITDGSLGTITAKTGGTDAAKGTISIGTSIEFTANPETGKTFYGWVDENNKLLSTEPSFRYTVSASATVFAIMDTTGSFAVRAGETFYKPSDIESAFTAAGSLAKKDVIVVDDFSIENSLTIPKGVNFILPIDRAGSYYELGKYNSAQPSSPDNTASPTISWASGSKFATPVVTLTVGSNVKITVNGNLYVGGVLHCQDQSAQGHTSGKYSQLILDGSIEVEAGGVMDVYGRVTGEGGITVKSGGELYQPFLILDYAGGTNTEGLFNHNQTPFKRYAMINIQCSKGYTIEYGGELLGHASLYFLSSVTTLDTQFISYVGEVSVNGTQKKKKGTTTLINLKDGASATGIYTNDSFVTSGGGNTENIGHTTLTIKGGATAGYMDFLGLVQTNGVAFSIPYNYNIVLEKGNGQETDQSFDLNYDFKLMPGASLTVGEGATLNLNAKFYVYDGLVQSKMSGKAYPTAEELGKANYKTNANFIVNGTLNINSGATFLGVIQTTNTEGTAQVVIGDNVTLTGKIVDGGLTDYDCNYAEYPSSARIWDNVHQKLATLETGKTYTSTYTGKEKFGIDAIEVNYDSSDGYQSNTKVNHQEHTSNQYYITGNTNAVEGLTGAWKVEHEKHQYDWTLTEDDKQFASGEKYKEITHYCTELGCNEGETKLLLSEQTLPNLTYNGTEFDGDALLAKFKEHYGLSEELATTYGLSLSVKDNAQVLDAATYYLTVSLTKGYFVDGKSSKEYNITVTPYNLSGLSEDEQQAIVKKYFTGLVYSGEAHKPSLDIKGKNFKGSATYEYGENCTCTNAGEASVTISGTENFTGELTFTFSIAKATLTITLIKQTAVYSGKEPTVSSGAQCYELKGLCGEDSVTVTLAFADGAGANGWNVGSYDLTATIDDSSNNYELQTNFDGKDKFEITQKDVTGGGIKLSATTATYNGREQKLFQGFTLEGFESLVQDTDYDVSYTSDVTNVGEVTVTVTGQNNFSGTATATYQIEAYDITGKSSSATVQTPEGGFVYKGEAWTPTINFTLEGITGDISSYYELGYDSNTNAGQATITVTGKDNFKGEFTLNFEIKKATLTITPDPKHSPKGQQRVALTARADGLFPVDKEKFEAAKDEIYNLSCTVDAQSAEGKYDITVTIEKSEWENYNVVAGSGKEAYTVTAEVFANVKFPDIMTAVYNGKAHTVEVTLGDPGGETKGTFGETMFTYHKNNTEGEAVHEMKDAGSYLVTAHITFTSDNGEKYETDISTTFTITPKALTESEVTIVLEAGDYTYTGEQIKPTVKSVTCGELAVSEFETAYENNTNAGSEAVVKVTGKGNFSGTVSTKFTIAPRSLVGATVALAENRVLVYNGEAQTPNVTVTVSVGEETLTLTGNDFTPKYSNNVHAGAAEVTVEGKGNYTGSPAAIVFTITAKQIAVTINDQSLVYTGEAPVLEQDRWTTLQNAIEGQDDLQITLTAVNAGEKWNVGTYNIQGVAGNQDYQVTFTEGQLTITKKAIKVTVEDITAVYGAETAALTFSVEEGALGTGDTKDDLKVTLTLSGAGTRLGVGSYMISGTAAESNYTVTFAGSWGEDHKNGTYTVTAKKITVTIVSKEKVYDGTEPTLTQNMGTDWTVDSGAIESGDDLHVALKKAEGVNVKAGGYAITGTAANSNYEVEWVNGVFTITPRPVTVTIADQSDTYNYEHKYNLDNSKWELDANTPLAAGEELDDLQITLTMGATDAGSYALTGVSANGNYAVTFKGAYSKDGDPQSGKAGVYTVNKRDITDDENAIFFMTATGGDFTGEGTRTLRVTFTGLALELSCGVTYREGTSNKTLKTTLSASSLTATGEYEITVTVDDSNYSGTAVFTVIVTDADGYTEALQQKLSRLAELAAGKDKNALTADDFGDIKEIAGILAGMTETEKELAAERLTQYSGLVEAWNELADVGDVAETAEAIAGSLIEALFAATAALSALIGLAYITLKGGIL